ncbi:MAG TPA: GtrA family protein [Arachnia sp.]|nr:GtrA family protein [Arachnia sp.]HMT84731.1 GtrA family protein [Arachnia sp.]
MTAFLGKYGNSMRQFVKFGIVGSSGVLVNMVITVAMNRLNGGVGNARSILWSIPLTPFNVRFTHLVWIVAFLIANLWNFQLNRGWTFRSSRAARWWGEFWPFLAVGSVAAGVGLLVKILLSDPTSPLFLPEPYFHDEAGLRSREYWAQLIAILVTLPLNFAVNKLWTFRAVRSAAVAAREGADR